MIITVQTFKESGKWYDTFEDGLPSEIPIFETQLIVEYLKKRHSQCRNMAFVFTIDGIPRLALPTK